MKMETLVITDKRQQNYHLDNKVVTYCYQQDKSAEPMKNIVIMNNQAGTAWFIQQENEATWMKSSNNHEEFTNEIKFREWLLSPKKRNPTASTTLLPTIGYTQDEK